MCPIQSCGSSVEVLKNIYITRNTGPGGIRSAIQSHQDTRFSEINAVELGTLGRGDCSDKLPWGTMGEGNDPSGTTGNSGGIPEYSP